jgi:hypothetical protein
VPAWCLSWVTRMCLLSGRRVVGGPGRRAAAGAIPRGYRPHPNAVAAIKRTDPVTVIQPAPIKHAITSRLGMTLSITVKNDPSPHCVTSHL